MARGPIEARHIEQLIQAIQELKGAPSDERREKETGVVASGAATGLNEILQPVLDEVRSLVSHLKETMIDATIGKPAQIVAQEAQRGVDDAWKSLHQAPQEQARAWVEDMAQAGRYVSTEELKELHRQQMKVADAQIYNLRRVNEEYGLVGDVSNFFLDMSTGIHDYLKPSRRNVESQKAVYDNYKLHGD